MSGKFKHIVSYLFLALFISIKFAGLHVLSHDEDKDHVINCTICDHIITNDHTPLLPSDSPEYTVTEVNVEIVTRTSTTYHFQYSPQDIAKHLFSRPPPTV